MVFKFAIVFIAMLVAGNEIETEQEKCGHHDILKCFDPMFEAAVRGADLDETCREMELSHRCVKGKAELCLSEVEQAEIKRNIQLIENYLEKHCSDDKNEITNGSKAVTEQEECTGDKILDCLNPLLEAAGSEVNLDVACFVIASSYECVKGKAELCLSEEEQTEIQSDLQPIQNRLEQKCSNAGYGVIIAVTGNETETGQERCEFHDILKCLDPTMEAAVREADSDEACRAMEFSHKCVKDTAELCLSEEEQAEIKSIIQQMENNFKRHCSDDENEITNGGKAVTEQEGCADDEILDCLNPLLEAEGRKVDLDELCRATALSHGCVKGKAELCLSEEKQADIQSELQLIENLLEQNCSKEGNETRSDNIDYVKCAKDNHDYISDCFVEKFDFSKIEGFTAEKELCIYNRLVVDCATERAVERCGEQAGEMINAKMKVILIACPNPEK